MIGRSDFVITTKENASGNSQAHMSLCRDICARISSDSLEVAGLPLTHQGSGISMEEADRDTTEDNRIGIGMVITDTISRTQMYMPR